MKLCENFARIFYVNSIYPKLSMEILTKNPPQYIKMKFCFNDDLKYKKRYGDPRH